MMAEHTPGPWQATRCNWKGEPVEHEFYIHGNEHKSRTGNYATGVAIVCGNATSCGVTDANARLIAAAPALLAVCEMILAYHTYSTYQRATDPPRRVDFSDVLDAAEEAVKIAKGKQ
jgi:hypothetical protein